MTTTFIHTLSGRTFTATDGEGTYGPTSRDGVWDDGTVSVIWPDEPLLGGVAWTEVRA